MARRLLVTLSGGTCSGKNYLLSQMVGAGFQRVVSTTTRPPRDGEVEGVEYYFISDEESRKIEAEDGFAELMQYGAFRYGVTKAEFDDKLAKGACVLIVEPKGMESYTEYSRHIGAEHFSVFVDTSYLIREGRFQQRFFEDFKKLEAGGYDAAGAYRFLVNYGSRHALLQEENGWGKAYKFNLLVDGTRSAVDNTDLIKDHVRWLSPSPDFARWMRG